MKQYAASPIIQKLISDRDGYFATNWPDQFYSNVWNIDTAQGFGLDIWGRIVGVGRNIQITEVNFFGFNAPPDQSWNTFGDESYYSGLPMTATFRLADNAYRTLILAKAMSNIASTDCRSLNRVVSRLFLDRGRAWVNDLGNMSMRITFEFTLEPWEFSVMTAGGVMPRPAGVGVTLAQIPVDTFGFAEAGEMQPFNQGTFLITGAFSNVD